MNDDMLLASLESMNENLFFLQRKLIFFKASKICVCDLFFNLNCKNFIFFVFKTEFKIIKYFFNDSLFVRSSEGVIRYKYFFFFLKRLFIF